MYQNVTLRSVFLLIKGLEFIELTATPFAELSDEAVDLAFTATGQAGRDAYVFLNEPLYMMAHSYGPADWIRWPLCAMPTQPDVYEIPYLLELGGWSAGWSADGVFVFDRRR